MRITDKITGEYIKDLLVRMAHHSTAIEGNSLTQAEKRINFVDIKL